MLTVRAATEIGNSELLKKLTLTYNELSQSKRRSKWRELLIVKVVQESEDVKSFYLVESIDLLPTSLAGQHILVEREKQPGSLGGFRCYSLSDDCDNGYWRISVKKNSEDANSISRWLHEEKGAGDTLKVKGPAGSFYFKPVAGRVPVLVSAGIGISPMMPMLIEALRHNCAEAHFFTQCRDFAHMPFADSLLDIAKKNPQIGMQIWVSRWPQGVRRQNGGMFFDGKFQVSDLLRHSGSISLSDYYLCGPEKWQETLRANLIEAGVPAAAIRYELFQQAEKPAPSSKFANHRVHFKQSGAHAKFESDYSSILTCAGKTGVELESGCRTGACGSCAVILLKGKVRYTREPQFQMDSNEILPCVCVPESDLVVDA